MIIYYTQDENGKITAWANWKFSPDALETDRTIVTGSDGQLYFLDDLPEGIIPVGDEYDPPYLHQYQA